MYKANMRSSTSYDYLIQKNIMDQIRWDARVSQYDVSIRVSNGVVNLAGFFDADYRHEATINIIQAIAGVHELRDTSRVLANYSRPDKEIKRIINQQVSRLSFLKGEWISVQVCDGVVKLEGEVYRPRVKAFADRIVWELSGVKDCLNFIDLTVPDSNLIESIETQAEKVVSLDTISA